MLLFRTLTKDCQKQSKDANERSWIAARFDEHRPQNYQNSFDAIYCMCTNSIQKRLFAFQNASHTNGLCRQSFKKILNGWTYNRLHRMKSVHLTYCRFCQL